MSTDGFKPLRKVMLAPVAEHWTLSFAERPFKLFTGVEKRLTIWVTSKSATDKKIHLSRYRRWFSEERNCSTPQLDALFSAVRFTDWTPECALVADSIPKIGTDIERSVLSKLAARTTVGTRLSKSSDNLIYYTRKLRYFVQFFDFVPEIRDARGKLMEPSELKELHARSKKDRDALLCALNTSLFFWFFSTYSDVRNINKREIEWFRLSLDAIDPELAKVLGTRSAELMRDFKRNSKVLVNDYKNQGRLSIQSFQPRLSKPVIDEIDEALAPHYEFTAEELDFIINFDFKYRMGQDTEPADDEEEGSSATAGA